MEILNTEKKIINKNFEKLDDLVEAYYFYAKQNYVSDSLTKYLLNYLQKYDLTIKEFIETSENYEKVFERKLNNFREKVAKTNFIKVKAKEISKIIGSSVSQTRLKKLVTATFCLIVGEISDKKYRMSFDDETMDQFVNLLDDEDLLKSSFNEAVIRSIKDGTIYAGNDDFDFEYCCNNAFADYYIDYYYNDGKNKDELKNNIENLLIMNKTKLKSKADKLKQKSKESEEAYEKDSKELIDKALNELNEKILSDLKDKGVQMSQQEGKNILESFLDQKMHEENDKLFTESRRILNKAKETIKKYFQYKDEVDEDFLRECYFRILVTYMHRQKMDNESFIQNVVPICFTALSIMWMKC